MEIGEMLPQVTLVGTDDVPFDLAARAGTGLIVYFYPKADTAGCTREGQEFSALLHDFAKAGTAVLGISRDTPAKLAKFAAKYALAVPLASDATGDACAAFGVWGEKLLYGRTYMGIERATFAFDDAGRLRHVWRKVKVPGHAAAVLAAIGG